MGIRHGSEAFPRPFSEAATPALCCSTGTRPSTCHSSACMVARTLGGAFFALLLLTAVSYFPSAKSQRIVAPPSRRPPPPKPPSPTPPTRPPPAASRTPPPSLSSTFILKNLNWTSLEAANKYTSTLLSVATGWLQVRTA